MIIRLSEIELCRDGSRLQTPVIQRLLDNIAAAGGGELIITPGKYLVGSLSLLILTRHLRTAFVS